MRGPPARHPDDSREQLPAVEGVILDAGELSPGDRVVYPNQGVCAVVGIEEKDIAGQKLQLVRMAREEDGAAVLVPRNKIPSIGLRRVATGDQMEGVFHYLAAQFDDPELDWKVRHRDNADRLIAGGVLGVAEVVKGLHSLSRLRPLPGKEREQYDNARHLLVHEVAVSLAVPAGLAEDYIDYALMPPEGVKFDLKPPPTPVLLPSRPKKRRPVVAEEEEGDLGLADLGLGDLGIDIEGALAAVPEGVGVEGVGVELPEGAEGADAADGAEGADAAEEPGTEPAEAEAGGDEDEDEQAAPLAPPRTKKAPAKAKKPAPAKAEKPAKAVPKPAAKKTPKKAAAEKPAPRAAEKGATRAAKAPAKKPAEKPAKAAPKRGGKKK